MKILFVCHRLPFPPNRGGKIRPFNMIQHLSRKHEVVVASLAESQSEIEQGVGITQYCSQLIAELVPPAQRWLQAVRALPTPMPSSVAYFWSPTLKRRVREVLSMRPFDAVWVHCAFVARYVEDWRDGLRVLDYGDLDSWKWEEYSNQRAFPLRLGYAIEAKKMRRYERNLASQFDQCAVTTEGELEDFLSLGVETPCRVIPNGVDSNYFSLSGRRISRQSVVVFLGRMDYYPNVDGILYFVQDILPLIQKQRRDVELRIVGSNPTLKIRALAKHPGIVVTGHVQDVRPHMADASVAIAPLRVARGTQNKILECMAMGIPVVATPVAAKGILASPGKHLLVAPDSGAFADSVLSLLSDGGLWDRLSRSALFQVRQAHEWSRSMEVLEAVLNQARRRN